MDYQKIKKTFEKNGFYIIKDFLDEKDINGIKDVLIKGYKKNLDKNIDENNIHEIISFYEHNGKYDKLYFAFKKIRESNIFNNLSKKLTKLGNGILEKKTKLINSGYAIGISGSKRTAYEWHQEKPYYENSNTLHFQFPIMNPLNKKNGTMSVLSGSHKGGFITNVTNKKNSNKSVNSFIPKNIKNLKSKHTEKHFNMGLKDIAVFDENLVHRSNKNLSKKIRFAGIIRLEVLN